MDQRQLTSEMLEKKIKNLKKRITRIERDLREAKYLVRRSRPGLRAIRIQNSMINPSEDRDPTLEEIPIHIIPKQQLIQRLRNIFAPLEEQYL